MAKRPDWFTRLLLVFYGPANHSRPAGPRTSPEVPPPDCPSCGQPLSLHRVTRVGGKSRTTCPTGS
jgi:hypothetical protein